MENESIHFYVFVFFKYLYVYNHLSFLAYFCLKYILCEPPVMYFTFLAA